MIKPGYGVYRFVGSGRAGIFRSPYQFEKFGQIVEMPIDLAEHCVMQGVALLPAEEFCKIPFTPDELRRYSRFDLHAKASQEFEAKKRQAWGLVSEYRSTIQSKAGVQHTAKGA